jgi:hypothetical protein
MSHGRDLLFDDPLCPAWLENVRQLMGFFSSWFGWRPIKIESLASACWEPTPDRSERRVLCFSGGVDSFYSLLAFPQRIDALMMVHGYDILLEDEFGAQTAFEHVQQVAAEMKVDAIKVSTNYRKHSVAGKKYKYAYGGALAGIGHLLGQTSELVISSGLRYDEVCPNGSQWQTDPLWSSRALKIIHYGAHRIRDDKLREIAMSTVMRKHLHVCQENLTDAFSIDGKFLNCGKCAKCVRTLLVLRQSGDVGDLETFANVDNLDVYLGEVAQSGGYLLKAFDEICRRGVDEKTERAIHALIRRSKVLNRMGWAGRQGRKAVYRIFRALDAVERRICSGRSLSNEPKL